MAVNDHILKHYDQINKTQRKRKGKKQKPKRGRISYWMRGLPDAIDTHKGNKKNKNSKIKIGV